MRRFEPRGFGRQSAHQRHPATNHFDVELVAFEDLRLGEALADLVRDRRVFARAAPFDPGDGRRCLGRRLDRTHLANLVRWNLDRLARLGRRIALRPSRPGPLVIAFGLPGIAVRKRAP